MQVGQIWHGHFCPLRPSPACGHDVGEVSAHHGHVPGHRQGQGIPELGERAVAHHGVDGHNGAVSPAKSKASVAGIVGGHRQEFPALERLRMTLVHVGRGGPTGQGDGVVRKVADVQVERLGVGVVEPVVAQGVVGPVGREHERRASGPKRRLQVVEPVPPQRSVVVRHDVVAVEVALAVLEGGHEQVPPVGGARHVEHLVDLEQLFQVHFSRAQIDDAQVGGTFQVHGEEQELALRPPGQPWVQFVVQPVQPVPQRGVPGAFAAVQVHRAHPQLTAFVGRERRQVALWVGQELGVRKPGHRPHRHARPEGTPRLAHLFAVEEWREQVGVPFWRLSKVVGLHFQGQILEERPRRKAEPALDALGHPGHVEHVGHRRKTVDVRHVRPHGLSEERGIHPAGQLQLAEGVATTEVEDGFLADGVQPPSRVTGEAVGHPRRRLNDVARPDGLAPIGLVHGLVEQHLRQPFTHLPHHGPAVARGVHEHLAAHQPGGPSEVGGFVLAEHHANVALPEFFLRVEHQDLKRPFQLTAKHRCQGVRLALEHAGDLACDLVSLAVMVHLEVALFKHLPLERAVLHPVLAERHVHAVGELGAGVRVSGSEDPQPTQDSKDSMRAHSTRNYAPWCILSRATPLASRPTSWNMEMVD